MGELGGAEDMGAATHAVVINQTMARRYFPHENPIGHRFGFGAARHSGDFVIVGVVRDSEFLSPREKVPAAAFLPFFAMRSSLPRSLSSSADVRSNYAGWLGVRTAGDPRALAKEVRKTIAQVYPNLPVASITTLNDQVDESMNQERLVSDLSAGFGILALVIAAIGLYGLIAYMAARRTGEIGLRMALGAETGDVLRMVLRQGLALALLGVAVGLGCASAVARLLASLLYGVKPGDPLTFITVAVILTALALLACYIPARRATKVDPIVALRYE